jgi:hypothetical protein
LREDRISFPATGDGPWAHRLDGSGCATYVRLQPVDESAELGLKKRTLTALYNDPPSWLSELHRELDRLVFAAYDLPQDATAETLLAALIALNKQRAR